MARTAGALYALVFLAVFGYGEQAAVGAGDFTHHEALDEEDKFNLFWKFDDEKIEFEAHVQTTGWFGLGLSPNGGMPGSDIVIGWVKDGTAHLTDRYADAKAQPSMDESQDWELISGNENGTHTVVRFNRKLTTCDDKDRIITEDTMRLIWAWHDQDPDEESGANGPSYHGTNKGVRATRLLEKIVPDQTSSVGTTYTVDFLMKNVTIPDYQDTTYWCRVFEMPKLDSKHHMIKAEPIVQPGNEGTVHHLLLYSCKRKENFTMEPEEHPGHECHTPNMPSDWEECYMGSIVLAWAIGGGDIIFPEHVGYPIGDDDDSGYVLMEMHYDNPLFTSGIQDTSGMRLTYTPELRDIDMGTLEVGYEVNHFLVVPPHVEEFTTAAFCSAECLGAFLEEHGQPIHIFGVNLHSHLLGVRLNVRLIRDGVETDIVRDDNYDFNLQFLRMLKEDITIYPGDSLVTECVYDSSHKDSVVVGGFGTPQEMCDAFLLYYPKFNMARCESRVNAWDVVDYAGAQEYTFGEYDSIHITAPAHMVNMSWEEAMDSVPWTNEKGLHFSEYLMNSSFHSVCYTNHLSTVDTGAVENWDARFPRGTRRPKEDICSRSAATPTPDGPVGGSTALRPQLAVVYALTMYLLALVMIMNE
ncbi:DBH-like monooxygenase protein 1 homolog [Branchiostoma lanceolatum]|uniref:DBH-like monooxygenase protein 1 homolog n=1 Tax=Branchiostoma lanceolatum TaxID=7740 RepID=UPI003453D3DB